MSPIPYARLKVYSISDFVLSTDIFHFVEHFDFRLNQWFKLNCRIWLSTGLECLYTGTDPNGSALAQPRICFLRKWIVMKRLADVTN